MCESKIDWCKSDNFESFWHQIIDELCLNHNDEDDMQTLLMAVSKSAVNVTVLSYTIDYLQSHIDQLQTFNYINCLLLYIPVIFEYFT
jgi:hypothetical protein